MIAEADQVNVFGLSAESTGAAQLEDTRLSWLTGTHGLPQLLMPGQICDAFSTRLRRAVIWYELDAIGVIQKLDGQPWRRLVHAFRIEEPASREALKAILDDRAGMKTLKKAVERSFAWHTYTDPLEVRHPRGVMSLLNFAARLLGDETCMAVALNRHRHSSDRATVWSKQTCDCIYRTLTDLPKSILQISHESYESDFPDLAKKHLGKWIVYHGAHQYGPFEDELAVREFCNSEGIPLSERFVRRIVPEPPFSRRMVPLARE